MGCGTSRPPAVAGRASSEPRSATTSDAARQRGPGRAGSGSPRKDWVSGTAGMTGISAGGHGNGAGGGGGSGGPLGGSGGPLGHGSGIPGAVGAGGGKDMESLASIVDSEGVGELLSSSRVGASRLRMAAMPGSSEESARRAGARLPQLGRTETGEEVTLGISTDEVRPRGDSHDTLAVTTGLHATAASGSTTSSVSGSSGHKQQQAGAVVPPLAGGTEGAKSVVRSLSSHRSFASKIGDHERRVAEALESRKLALDVAVHQLRRTRRASIKGESYEATAMMLATRAAARAGGNGELWQAAHRVVPKTENERMLIFEALGRNFVFSSLTAEEKRVIVDAMDRHQVGAGQALIQQGDAGDRCYVVETGQLDVLVNNVPVGSLSPGSLCGELALLYGSPRAATVRATFPSSVWALDRSTFRAIVLSSAVASYEEAKRFLRSVKLFSSLTDGQIGRLAEALQRVEFRNGVRIINQGDIGAVFYLIQRGRVRVVKAVQDFTLTSTGETLDSSAIAGASATSSTAHSPRGSSTHEQPRTAVAHDPHGRPPLSARWRGDNQQSAASSELSVSPGAATSSVMSAWAEQPSLAGGIASGRIHGQDTAVSMSALAGVAGDNSQRRPPASQAQVDATSMGMLSAEGIDSDADAQGEELDLMTLEAGSWFGEQALLNDEPRAASVIAEGDVVCLALHRDHFFQLLGSLEEILRAQHAQRAQVEQTVRMTRSMRSMSGIVAGASSHNLSLHGIPLQAGASSASAAAKYHTDTDVVPGGVLTRGSSRVLLTPFIDDTTGSAAPAEPGTPDRQVAIARASPQLVGPVTPPAPSGTGSAQSPVLSNARSPFGALSAVAPATPGEPLATSSRNVALSTPAAVGKQPSYSSLRPTEGAGDVPPQSSPHLPSAASSPLNTLYSTLRTPSSAEERSQADGREYVPIGPLPAVRAVTVMAKPAVRVPGQPSSPSSNSKASTGEVVEPSSSTSGSRSTAPAPSNPAAPSVVARVYGLPSSTSNASAGGAVGPYHSHSVSEGQGGTGLTTLVPLAGKAPASPSQVPPVAAASMPSVSRPAQVTAQGGVEAPPPVSARAGASILSPPAGTVSASAAAALAAQQPALGSVKSRGQMASAPIASFRVARPDIRLSDLDQLALLGEGAFGLVRLVRHRQTGEVFALKQMQKARIVATNQQKNVMSEKRIMSRLKHPFIIELVKTFKDRDSLYLLLEFLQAGDMFGLLLRQGGVLDVWPAQYYSAIVTSALEYLHDQNIVYRDLKPENLLLDAEGFLKCADMGFAKILPPGERTFTLCGTPEYLAPELVQGKGHHRGVDYWALGVLIYELLAGYSPFADHDNNDQVQIYKNILKGNLRFPSHLRDPYARDLIKKLLTPNPSQRVGCLKGGVVDIKRHKWFAPIDWDALLRKEIPPPIKPTLKSKTDTSCFDDISADTRISPFHDDDAWCADF